MDMTAYFRKLYAYEAWANERVGRGMASGRASVESGAGAAAAAPWVRAVEIWAHVQCARRLWMSRLDPKVEPPTDGLFPAWSLERTAAECTAVDALWSAYTARLDEAEIARTALYHTTEGDPYTTPVVDILAHVVNHSHYHRGQLARLVAECGGKLEPTDYIFFVRQQG